MSTLHTGAAAPTLPADLKFAFEPRPARISTLERLINRGDQVAIVDGILHIQPISAKPVPNDWYNANLHRLVAEIAEAMNVAVYSYDSYSTGRYKGGQKRLYSGLILQFINVVTHENARAIFNVDLTRSRNSTAGKKGDPLPFGRFNITKKYLFYNFWDRLNIAHPRYMSEYHEHMGKLRHIFFSMTVNAGKKATNESIIPISIAHHHIMAALNNAHSVRENLGENSGFSREKVGNSLREGNTAKPDNTCLTSNFNYVSELPLIKLIHNRVNTALGADSSESNTIEQQNKSTKKIEIIKPENQSIDEWLADYESE